MPMSTRTAGRAHRRTTGSSAPPGADRRVSLEHRVEASAGAAVAVDDDHALVLGSSPAASPRPPARSRAASCAGHSRCRARRRPIRAGRRASSCRSRPRRTRAAPRARRGHEPDSSEPGGRRARLGARRDRGLVHRLRHVQVLDRREPRFPMNRSLKSSSPRARCTPRSRGSPRRPRVRGTTSGPSSPPRSRCCRPPDALDRHGRHEPDHARALRVDVGAERPGQHHRVEVGCLEVQGAHRGLDAGRDRALRELERPHVLLGQHDVAVQPERLDVLRVTR